jgi:hypothetical protein
MQKVRMSKLGDAVRASLVSAEKNGVIVVDGDAGRVGFRIIPMMPSSAHPVGPIPVDSNYGREGTHGDDRR